ncbi:MAG: metalloregulator ArsR/SmtB family transcription factor [Pseudomonadota bacterium]
MSVSLQMPLACKRALGDNLQPGLFKALSDPVRIAIVCTLAARTEPLNVSSLTGCCGVDMSGVSRHLKILLQAGILSADKRGREVYYSLQLDVLAETLRAGADALEACREACAEK